MSKHGGPVQPGGDVVCIVMEFGSRWPACTHELRSHAAGSIVIAQDVDEDPASFAARVSRRISRVACSGLRVSAAMLSAGHGLGDEVFAARCLIIQALARAASPWGERDLILAGHDQLSEEARHGLVQLAGAISQHLNGIGPSIRLEVDQPRSAVRTARPRVSDTAPRRDAVWPEAATTSARGELECASVALGRG